ncbi:MAG: glutathione S-transferase family protein [Burkholderiales bacterium]|jgi:glutathione S-transferase|nr:glutathione S-transferase family protein [Burkholderiales bacterium]
MLKLFYALNTCALASHIALEEANAQYEAVRLDFRANDQSKPEYLAINPKARVPALITEQGILTETPAILAYIAQTFPEARLAPLADPYAFARIQAFNSYLCSTVHVAHAHGRRGYRWADDPVAIKDMQRKVPETVGACFELIEREMFTGPWVTGGDYSICDPYLFTISGWLKGDSVDIARFPRVHDHYTRMSARAAVKKVLAVQS